MLLETIAGLRPHRSGTIRLAGADITAWPPEQRRIGLVFQDAALFPHLSVAENIRFGPRATRQAPAADLDSLLRRLGITPLAARAPRSLSGGERQRVALARALAIQPALLLLDEPLSALDQPTREDLRTLLSELLAALDIPAVHVTHDRDEALSISNDLAIITGGQLRQAGPASQVTAAPADPETARLLGWTELGPGTAANGTVQGRPDPPPRRGANGHPGPYPHLLPARRPHTQNASPRRTSSRRPHRADRADPAHPPTRPHHSRLRPAHNGVAAAPRPRNTPPGRRQTRHGDLPPGRYPHLPHSASHLEQQKRSPCSSRPASPEKRTRRRHRAIRAVGAIHPAKFGGQAPVDSRTTPGRTSSVSVTPASTTITGKWSLTCSDICMSRRTAERRSSG